MLCYPVFAFSQPKSNESAAKSNLLLPGATTSIPFILKNDGIDTIIYKVRISTSASTIIPIIAQRDIKIAPDNQFVFIAPIRISSSTLKGSYLIQLTATSQVNGNSINLSKEISVTGSRKLTLTKISSQEYIRAGDTIQSSFLIQNTGNTTESLQLKSNGQIKNTGSQINLKPGDSKMIYVERISFAASPKNDNTSIQLQAITNDTSNYKLTAFSNTTIIAMHPKEQDAFLRLPVDASVSYIGMRELGNFKGGMQAELYGKGYLREGGSDLIEFHAITASPIPFNSYSKYEEYYIHFENKKIYAHIGDKSFSSSYMTEYYRYGRGAEFQYTSNRFTFGGFFNHPRFFQDIENEFNLFSKVKIKKSSELTLGYLYKAPGSDSAYYSAYGLREKTQLPYLMFQSDIIRQRLNMESEIAYSTSENETGTGYRIQLNGNIRRLSGYAQYLNASPHFNGYFRNSTALNSYMHYRISNKLNISTNYNQDARNIQRDTLFLSAPLRRSYQLGLNYLYLKSGTLSLYGGNRKYEDRMEPRQFNYMERYTRIAIDQKISTMTIGLESQFAKTFNYITNSTGNSQYYTANLGIAKWQSSLNLYGSYANTSRYQKTNQNLFYYGARLTSPIGKKSHVNIFYQNEYQPEDYYRNRNLFELQFHQNTFKNQSFELAGRYTLQQGQLFNKDYIFSFKYIVRLNLPVKRIAHYTTVKGTIQNNGQQKAGDIRVWLGNHSTLTDAMGNYTFKNVIPGDYLLDIDRTSLAINDIPTFALPTMVNIKEEPIHFDFGLTKSGKIEGTLVIDEDTPINNAPGHSLRLNNEKVIKGQIIIEASNGTETYRQLCAIGDSFEFSYLRPGSWQINFYRNGLDKNYKILDNKFNFELKPGAAKQMQVHIVKKQVNIQFQQGDIKVSYGEKQ